MRAALFGMIHVNLHKGYTASSVNTATFTKQVGFKVELLPWLREVAKFSSSS